ncbi:MAG: DMT family transporter [Candidatus Heimdallarchaeota archaeon]|nr:DMT family transporter [Candidatus Heimdallarchaeota archaeon]MCK4769475.1 DMT family transporter [Candidatus Heimdallarchaeota archaeon]
MDGRIFAVLAVVCFATSNSMIRKVEKIASPLQINAVRTTIGGITFVIAVAIMGFFLEIFTFSYKIWLLLIASIVCAQVLGDTFYFQAQKTLGTTKALAVSMTFPLFTFLFSVIILHSQIHYIFYISAFLIICGVLLIAKSQEQTLKKLEQENNQEQIEEDENAISKKSTWLAVLAGLLAAISWAIGVVLIDWVLNDIADLLNTETASSLIGNAARFPIAAVLLLFMAWRKPYVQIGQWSKKSWKWLLAASIIGTSLGAFFYAEGARSAGAELMSLIAAASPLFALPVTWFLNKERINFFGLFGVFMTIAGVVLVLISG